MSSMLKFTKSDEYYEYHATVFNRKCGFLPRETEMITSSFYFTVTGTFDADKLPDGITVSPEQEGQKRVVAQLGSGVVHVPHNPSDDGRKEAELAVNRYHMPSTAPGMEDTAVHLRPF